MHALSGFALQLSVSGLSAEEFARRLRTGASPVVGRIAQDRLLLDLRTVADPELAALAVAIAAAIG